MRSRTRSSSSARVRCGSRLGSDLLMVIGRAPPLICVKAPPATKSKLDEKDGGLEITQGGRICVVRERRMSKKPVTHWTLEELEKIVAKKSEAATKHNPGPKRQKLLREAKRYKCLLDAKTALCGESPP